MPQKHKNTPKRHFKNTPKKHSSACLLSAVVTTGDAYLFCTALRVQWWGSLAETPLPASSLTRNSRNSRNKTPQIDEKNTPKNALFQKLIGFAGTPRHAPRRPATPGIPTLLTSTRQHRKNPAGRQGAHGGGHSPLHRAPLLAGASAPTAGHGPWGALWGFGLDRRTCYLLLARRGRDCA